MTVTVAVNDDAYLLIVKKQAEMFEKTRRKMRISDIVAKAIKKGIDLIEIE